MTKKTFTTLEELKIALEGKVYADFPSMDTERINFAVYDKNEKAMDFCNPSLFIFLYQKISLSNSPDTSRRASSHHPQSQPCESSRGYEAYLQR